jgi:hypothetical protein
MAITRGAALVAGPDETLTQLYRDGEMGILAFLCIDCPSHPTRTLA